MPITDIGSYVTTGEEFDAHWTDVDADRVANTLPVFALPDGYVRADLTADVAAVAARITQQESFDNGLSIATSDRDAQKTVLRDRLIDFRKQVDYRLKGSRYVTSLPDTPTFRASEQVFLRAMDDMSDLWTRINADTSVANFTPPLVFSNGATLAPFQTDLTAMRAIYKAVVDAENDAKMGRKDRDQLLTPLRDRFVLYREGIEIEYGASHPFTQSLPDVYPAPGSTPDAVVLSGYWDAALTQAVLNWTASTNPNLQVYELRGCIGASYNEAASEFLQHLAPGNLTVPTLFGFVTAGDTVTFKIFVHLTTGNQAGSNPVTITRT